jgi:hypothetical protein
MHRGFVAAAVLLASVGSAVSVAGQGRDMQAQQELRQAFPGVRLYTDMGRTRMIYGRSMSTAGSPEAAAERFLATHGDAFGVGQLRLVQTDSIDMRDGAMHVFHYTQTLGGLPVELSPGRVLTRANGDGSWSVVYAAGLFASLPEGGFAPMTRTGQDAVNFVRSSEQFGHLPVWSGAELVVWQRQTETGFEGVRAWKFVGENPDLVTREKYTFFVDASTGALLEARNEVHNIDVFGYAKGYATPGVLPDKAGNSPVLTPINDLRVAVTGGNNAYTDTAGFFNITHGGSSNVTITANFDTGRWCNVNDQSGTAVQSRSATATPGTEAYLEFNSAPSEYLTAQVNGFIHTGLIHNFFTDRSNWTGMDFVCTTNVNLNSTCNAHFDGSSINMYRAGGGCNNTAYSTVIAHEYGHYVVAKLFLGQGSFGEGYGDCCSELLYNTGKVGEDFFTDGGDIRDNDNTIVTYPCGGEIHYCGQALGGAWWHIRENFGATYGSAQGLTLAQQEFVDWSLITTGGSGNNGAHPGTAIEVLTIDDNDGNLDNGTPNYDDICPAFGMHNIPCPEVTVILFEYPDGLPSLMAPNQATDIDLNIIANGVNPLPNTAQVWYWIDGSGLTQGSVVYNGGSSYTATIGGADCTSQITYFFQVNGDDGNTYYDPRTGSYAASVYSDIVTLQDLDFESAGGFTVGDTGDNASTGVWNRQDPVGTEAQPENDVSTDGAQCWVTDGRSDGGLGTYDVDGGKTTLKSAVFNLADSTDPVVGYWRWYSNDTGGDPNNDTFRVDVTNGGAWVNAETVGPAGEEASGGWFYHEFRVSDFVTPNGTVQVRFIAEDASTGSLVEAAIDEFMITDGVCDDTCVADFNGDGNVNTVDVLAFLNAWSAGDSSADINGDGNVNTQDVLAFLNLWNAGC